MSAGTRRFADRRDIGLDSTARVEDMGDCLEERTPNTPRDPAKDWLKAAVRNALFGVPAEAQSIGRFRILRQLGAGGMGIVMLGYDEQLDRKVAIKLIATPRPDEVSKSRMLREARSMAKVTHPNVARVYEVGEFGGQFYVAMEYIAGKTLGEWLRDEQPGVLDIFLQAGRGLAAAHAAGIVHRDFKPSNVIVDESGRVMVLDFGLARTFEAVPDPSEVGDADHPRHDDRLTLSGSLLRTPAYMAPELGQVREAATSMAIVGDELVTGHADGALLVHPVRTKDLVGFACELGGKTPSLDIAEPCAAL